MNLTDNEIIKALECCRKAILNRDCLVLKCPFATEFGCNIDKEHLRNEALDLINRQKAEMERLTNKLEQREEMMANLGVELTTMRGAANSYKMHYEKAQAEIEKLQKHNEMVLENCRIFNKGVEEATNKRFLEAIDVVKTEAIKEFAERVKQEINFPLAVWKVFDNLVKEMVGE